jgi:hypothetical protein
VGARPRTICFRPAGSDGRRHAFPRRPVAVGDPTRRPVAELGIRGALDQPWLPGPGGGGPRQRLAPRLLIRPEARPPWPGDCWRALRRLTHCHHGVGQRHGVLRLGVEPVLHPMRLESGLLVKNARHCGCGSARPSRVGAPQRRPRGASSDCEAARHPWGLHRPPRPSGPAVPPYKGPACPSGGDRSTPPRSSWCALSHGPHRLPSAPAWGPARAIAGALGLPSRECGASGASRGTGWLPSPALKPSGHAVPAAGDASAGAPSAPSRPVGVLSAAPWGRPRGMAQWRWAYETPCGRRGLFFAPMIPCRHLYGYFC